MQSLIEYAPYWLAYFGFAVLGLWSWQRLFFVLIKHAEVRKFITLLGAVMLFTPAPSSLDSQHFAPAIFVLILDVLGGVAPLQSASLIWLLAALCLGGFILAVRSLSGRTQKESE